MVYSLGKPKKVFCIIPTYNRLDSLKTIIKNLNNQSYIEIYIIIINDGSTDGTEEYLKHNSQHRMTVIKGDGDLWWGGAMSVGMTTALSKADDNDLLLLLNDDCYFDINYIEEMVKKSTSIQLGAVVSPQYDINTKELSHVGYLINYYKQSITQVKNEPIDASVGRGFLIPVELVKKIGVINARVFQHYMGDIEFSARVKDLKYDLVVAWDAPMYSDLTPSDTHIQQGGAMRKLFHKRSKSNLFNVLKFFHRRGPLWTRVTALPRMLSRLGVSAIRSTTEK
jgi:GT2 family glycosyltransferase